VDRARPSADGVRAGLSITERARRKRDARPSWDVVIHELRKFGDDGRVDYDARGRIKGYQPPTSNDPRVQERINRTVGELFQPERDISIQQSGETNTARGGTRLRDPRTGRVTVVPDRKAERMARKQGLVEMVRFGRGTGLHRWWLTCGHCIERSAAPEGLQECPWGCGLQDTERARETALEMASMGTSPAGFVH